MQDLSSVTGSHAILNIKGERVIVNGFTFEDIGLIQGEIIRQKRLACLQSALLLKGLVSDAELERELEKSKAEAAKIRGALEDDLAAITTGIDGVSLVLWVVLERQYPGRFKEADVFEMVIKSKQNESALTWLMSTFEQLLGNEKSQGTNQAKVEQPSTGEATTAGAGCSGS